jgi:arsenate reductase
MTVTIYHNPRCTKSRQTLELLRGRGIEPTIIEYLKTPPNAAELKKLLARLGITPRQLLRATVAREAGIAATLDGDALIQAMVKHPVVIERPIVVNGGKAALGRPPEAVTAIL